MIYSTYLHRLKEVNQRLLQWLILGSCISLAGHSTNTAAVQLSREAQENLPTQVQIKADLHSPAPFYGMPDLKKADGEPGSMMYWGDAGIEGLFVQILFHALVANEVKNKEQLKAQEQANQVLMPYSELIDTITHKHLVKFALRNYPRDAVKFSIDGDDISGGDYIVVETSPAYFMSQDERSIILRHQLKAFLSSAPDQIIFENLAQTTSSQPYQGIDGWFGDSNENFRATAQRLYSVTFKALIKDLYGRLNEPSKEKTYKYYIGDERFYERASLIEETCMSQTIRNLRGNIMILEKQQVECTH